MQYHTDLAHSLGTLSLHGSDNGVRVGAHAYRSRACDSSCSAYRGSILSKMIEMAASAAEHCPSRSEPAHIPRSGPRVKLWLYQPRLLQPKTFKVTLKQKLCNWVLRCGSLRAQCTWGNM